MGVPSDTHQGTDKHSPRSTVGIFMKNELHNRDEFYFISYLYIFSWRFIFDYSSGGWKLPLGEIVVGGLTVAM